MNACSKTISESPPKVSVLMLAYNHHRYIAQAIQSVYAQKTNFEYELLIGDDCSTDGTLEVARSFQKQLSRISIFSAKTNCGMYHNFSQLFRAARGDYIAFLEGDDFWIAPEKLQRQIEHLEKNPEAVLCFHKARLVRDEKFSGEVFPQISKLKLTFEDFLQENWIPTCSAVFRRKALREIPEWCANLKLLDWPLFLLLAQRGEITFFPEALSAYRLHSAGAWSQLAPQQKSERMIEVLRAAKTQFGKEYGAKIDRRISELYEHIAWCCEERNALEEAFAASWKATTTGRLSNLQATVNCLRLALKQSGLHQ